MNMFSCSVFNVGIRMKIENKWKNEMYLENDADLGCAEVNSTLMRNL